MEKSIISSGKTIDPAIESALSQLGLDRDSVSVTVLQQAKSGFLGFGAQSAKVQVTTKSPIPCRRRKKSPRALWEAPPAPSPRPLPPR